MVDELLFPCRRRKHFTSSCHWLYFAGMTLHLGATCLYETSNGGGRKEMKVVAVRIDGYVQLSHSFLTIFWAGRMATIFLLGSGCIFVRFCTPHRSVSRGTFWWKVLIGNTGTYSVHNPRQNFLVMKHTFLLRACSLVGIGCILFFSPTSGVYPS